MSWFKIDFWGDAENSNYERRESRNRYRGYHIFAQRCGGRRDGPQCRTGSNQVREKPQTTEISLVAIDGLSAAIDKEVIREVVQMVVTMACLKVD
jgi:hypothetical protein